jgi:hypothetical protein
MEDRMEDPIEDRIEDPHSPQPPTTLTRWVAEIIPTLRVGTFERPDGSSEP